MFWVLWGILGSAIGLIVGLFTCLEAAWDESRQRKDLATYITAFFVVAVSPIIVLCMFPKIFMEIVVDVPFRDTFRDLWRHLWGR